MEKQFKITEEKKGLRLDQALTSLTESRTRALRAIQSGQVKINGCIILKASYLVKAGDDISVKLEDRKKQNPLKPYNYPIPIVYEDDFILVVEKPAGLAVHPSPGHYDNTLINALFYKLKNLSCGGKDFRPGLIHRLDKDVSGLIVLSKTESSHRFLSKQFLTRKIKRIYWSLCLSPIKFEKGRIESYIKRHPIDRKKFISSSSEGKKAVSLFKVLKKGPLVLIEWTLLTGRTHQIRIHSREISEGIAGDLVYSKKKAYSKIKPQSLIQKIKMLDRIALHAKQLSFIHPDNKKEITFSSPFPKKLHQLLDYN